MIIVPMETRHISELARIEQACFSTPWTENALREELGKGIFLVAEQEKNIMGYVGCQTVLDEGYITNVAVAPTYRRQGAGRALIRSLQTRARASRLTFVTLEVRSSNEPAIALYRQMGFTVVGVRPHFYTAPDENALLMTWYSSANLSSHNEGSGRVENSSD